MGLDEAAAVFGTASPGQIRAEFPEPEYLVVKNDAHHVTGFHGNVIVEVPSLTVDVVEKIGAGDAFAGGFLAGVITGKDIEHALRMGHICAASTLSTVRRRRRTAPGGTHPAARSRQRALAHSAFHQPPNR